MSAPVLAAIDPATRDLAPARCAALIAGHTGAPLIVAGVFADDGAVTRLAGGQFGEDLPPVAAPALDAALEVLPPGAEAMPVAAASAPRGLSFAALEIGAALLVVGSPTGTPAGRTAVGATTARLLDGAPCAVAVTPAGWDGAGRDWTTVGAGFVDSAEGRAATQGAHVLARGAGARLRVLAAVRRRPWMDGDDVEADLRARAEEASMADAASLLGTAVDADVEVGEPADVLLAASRELDLLVLGARGHGPERAALMGGVARAVTAGAACPVIVLARGPGVALADLVR